MSQQYRTRLMDIDESYIVLSLLEKKTVRGKPVWGTQDTKFKLHSNQYRW